MLNEGESGTAAFIVKESDTAQALSISPEDAFPRVFATSRMVCLMELAAARAMRRLLQPGQLSVGISITARHTAATPVGSEVRAVATFLRTEGKLFHFRVEVFDEAGRVGEGDHSRAIVDTERLLTGAERRRAAAEVVVDQAPADR